MEKKVAVVTGASKGIGHSMVEALLEDGWVVYGLSRSIANIEHAIMIPCDVSEEMEVKNAFHSIIKEAGRIDLLVNNAGMGISGAIEYTKSKDMHRIFDINFFGSVYCTQQVIPIMRRQGGGRIVYTSSLAAPCTAPFQTFYSATKNAINSLNEGLSLETKAFGIETCALLVGDRKTSFTEHRKKDHDGDMVYHGAIARCVERMEDSERSALPPSTIADSLIEILHMEKLPIYKVCDDYGQVYDWSGYKNKEKVMEYFSEKYCL